MPHDFQIPNQEQFLPRPAAAAAPIQRQAPRRQLDERVLEYILDVLESEPPQAPQLQRPRGLQPWEAAAGALNPQIIPFLQQRAGQGAAIANQQAQGAFEAQMAGRKEALGLAGPLLQAQATRERMGRPRTRIVGPIDIGGRPTMLQIQEDPATGELIGATELGERAFAPAIVPSPSGFQRVPRARGAATPVLGQGGQPILPPPPAGIVTGLAAQTATLGGLQSLRAAYQKVRAATTGEGRLTDVARQRVGTFVGETRLGGALAPEYAKYTAERRAALNAYIKSQTGAQFSVRELERYEAQYPEPWDQPDLAEQKIAVLEQRALDDMNAKLRAFPAAGGAAPIDDAERIMQEIEAEEAGRAGQ